MPLPLALAPLAAVLIAVGLFSLIRWWLGRTGAALFFTLSLLLNFTIFIPLALGIMAVQEVRDFQDKMALTRKLLLVERGSDILLAVSFTDLQDLDVGFSSFKPLPKEQVQIISATSGPARYSALAQDYYKVFVVKREFLEKLAAPVKPPPQATPGPQTPGIQSGRQDNAAIQNLLTSAGAAFQSGDLNKVASVATELQKAYRDRGMTEAADLARQLEQAARAKDMKALAALGPRLMQLSSPGSGGPLAPGSSGGLPMLPVSGDVIMKVIDADDPAKMLLPYLPQQSIQEMGGGDPARLKLMLVGYLLLSRFQTNFDPIFVVSEYRKGHIEIYPESNISALVKLLPVEQPDEMVNPKPKQ